MWKSLQWLQLSCEAWKNSLERSLTHVKTEKFLCVPHPFMCMREPTENWGVYGSIPDDLVCGQLTYVVRDARKVWIAHEMAQWVKVLISKSDNLSSIPGSHMVEIENLSQSLLLFSIPTWAHAYDQYLFFKKWTLTKLQRCSCFQYANIYIYCIYTYIYIYLYLWYMVQSSCTERGRTCFYSSSGWRSDGRD